MQIFVKTLTGKTIIINDIEESDSVATLKELVLNKAKTNIQPDDIRLIFGGKQLNDNYIINDYNINSGNTIFLLFRLRGGMDGGQLREGLRDVSDTPPDSSILCFS